MGLVCSLSRTKYFLVITVFNVKNLNKLGSENWKQIASKNYFDENGFFIFVFVALPLLLIGNFIMVSKESCSREQIFYIDMCLLLLVAQWLFGFTNYQGN